MSTTIVKTLLFFLACSLVLGCNQAHNKPTTKQYLHIAHTRTATNPAMDSTIEQLDYSSYDMLWLGGDMTYLSSMDDSTMQHIDNILNVGSPNTFWALGNHDYSDLNRVEQFTKRPSFYTHHRDGLTIVVLDTQDSLSNIINEQAAMLHQVLDTLEQSSHLIILHHKLIWMYGDSVLAAQVPSISNAGIGDCSYCINPNNFYPDFYNKLVNIQQKGIQVLCIGGDIGFHSSTFEHKTSDGIYFLASGINADQPDNKGLLFMHDIANKKLAWSFKPLENL